MNYGITRDFDGQIGAGRSSRTPIRPIPTGMGPGPLQRGGRRPGGGVESMIRRIPIILGLLAAASLATPADAQMLDARRLGMGGVATSDNNASRTANVAFRAVPTGQGSRSIPLPIGLIQY